METNSERTSRVFEEVGGTILNLKDIKMEDTLSHSGLAALAAAAADETALSANSNNKHTNRKTGADMKIFMSYLVSINENRDPQNIPEAELDKHLCSFFLIVKKTDKSEYEPCSLRSMLASIERYLKINGYPSSLTKDMVFANTRYTLKVKQKILREMGKGVKPNHYLNITSLKDRNLDRAFEAREMGPYNPASIAQTLCFVFVVYLRLRKATEHKKLLWGDVILDRDQNGREYITFSDQMLQRCTLQYLKQCQPVVYALTDTPERDPVRIYKLYASKRAPTMNYEYAPFYLGINIFNPTDNQSWYKSIAMGINKLNDMVRQVREVTGMTQAISTNDTAESPQDLSLSSTEKHSPSKTPEPHATMGNQCIVFNNSQHSKSLDINTATTSSSRKYHYVKDEPVDYEIEHHEESITEPFYVEPAIESSDDSTEVDEMADQYADSGSSSGSSDVDDIYGQSRDSDDPTTFKQKESPITYISLSDAQKQFEILLNKMQPDDVIKFETWLKTIKLKRENQTGQVICEPIDIKDKTSTIIQAEEQQILLNITLSNKAFKGEQPVTVTATSRLINSNNSMDNFSEKMNVARCNLQSDVIIEGISETEKQLNSRRLISKRLIGSSKIKSTFDEYNHSKRQKYCE